MPKRRESYVYKRGPRAGLWHREIEKGRWQVYLSDLLSRAGYIHKSGRWAGKVHIYRLAYETGFSYDVTKDIVYGRKPISIRMLARLCDVFRCQPNDVLCRVHPSGVPAPSPVSSPANPGNSGEYVSPAVYRDYFAPKRRP